MINYRDALVGVSYPVDRRERREEVRRELRTLCYRAAKRAADIAIALVGLAVTALPMMIIALIISADSKGCAIFKQKRVGRDGKLFNVYKFRTMQTNAPHETATGDLKDPYKYITRAGAFLRRTSIDELPQLFNVLKGDMSIVGPRPLIAGEYEIHRLRRRANVYSVKPGITGWAQINGRDTLSVEEKVNLDAEYVEKSSLLFDLGILIKTVLVVFRKDGYCEGSRN